MVPIWLATIDNHKGDSSMPYANFKELTDQLQSNGRRRVVLAAAQDAHALEAVLDAAKQGIVDYTLVGDKTAILAVATQHQMNVDESCILQADGDEASAFTAVQLIRQSKGDFLMKGKMMTSALLKAVVNSETGIRTGSIMSHAAILEVPTYHKLLCVSDGGMMPHPTLEQKIAITENAVALMTSMNCLEPKVAVLAGVEVENTKMPETSDAIAIANHFADRTDCLVQGPLSLDLILSRESAEIKGIQGPVINDADILIVPDMACGNIMSKALMFGGGATMAGCIIGAKVPIVLTSRGASTREKFLSLAMAAASCR